ncbi:MAG: Gfo/Idh/MocA family oxidoreductase [Ardenticatenaceae bacterium]|nr:Gfo/Idh/MocA family oxidoreductase [Ardenticatenaceae bacterium]
MTNLEKVRIGIAGLTHGHVGWILSRPFHATYEVVGIAEEDTAVYGRYAQRFDLSKIPIYTTLEEMLDTAQPEAVVAFGSIYDHLAVVQTCAPRGVHVMVEKPLAVNMSHAQAMADLARQHHIHLLTNYETTWYASNHAAYQLVHGERLIGEVWKVVIYDGHKGPQEIGVQPEFLAWLTDPVLNGGGAVIDFGCYGANLMTWLMRGEKPVAVTAVTQQIKPHLYPHVDDEATIVVTYPKAQAIIQGSWNWPIARKDMEVYGQTGQLHALNALDLRIQTQADKEARLEKLEPLAEPVNDPFVYFSAVIRHQTPLHDNDLSALSNNLTVVQILDAARESARSGQVVYL